MSDETTEPVKTKQVPLTDGEVGPLTGLFVAKQAVEEQILAFQSKVIAERIGVPASRFVKINLTDKWVSVKIEEDPK